MKVSILSLSVGVTVANAQELFYLAENPTRFLGVQDGSLVLDGGINSTFYMNNSALYYQDGSTAYIGNKTSAGYDYVYFLNDNEPQQYFSANDDNRLCINRTQNWLLCNIPYRQVLAVYGNFSSFASNNSDPDCNKTEVLLQ